jgi:TPR repeat protein
MDNKHLHTKLVEIIYDKTEEKKKNTCNHSKDDHDTFDIILKSFDNQSELPVSNRKGNFYYMCKLMNKSNFEKAKKLASNHMDCSYYQNNLGYVYEEEDKREDAEIYYFMAIEKGNSFSMNNLACMYEREGKGKDAEKYYLMAIEKDNSIAMRNLAKMYEKKGKKEDADIYYVMVIETEKENGYTITYLACLYETEGKRDEAEKYYLMAIEKNNHIAMNNLAYRYKKEGKRDEAEKYYLMAIDNGSISAIWNIGFLYEDENKVEDAVYWFNRSNNQRAKNKLKYLDKDGKFRECIKLKQQLYVLRMKELPLDLKCLICTFL